MMNEKDAQKLLRDRGPWEVRISGSEIVFKNKDGDVINLQGYVETFGRSTGYVEFNLIGGKSSAVPERSASGERHFVN